MDWAVCWHPSCIAAVVGMRMARGAVSAAVVSTPMRPSTCCLSLHGPLLSLLLRPTQNKTLVQAS